MDLTWYGTAALVFREEERAIAFDPFGGIGVGELKRPRPRLRFEEELRDVEAVFVTHGHLDHIYHLPRLYSDRRTAIYCTARPARTLVRRGLSAGQLRQIAPGWEGEMGPFALRAWQGRHCRFDLPLVARTVFCRRFWRHMGHTFRLLATHLTHPEGGEILFYEVTCGGVRVQVMGSMGLDPAADYPIGADYLVLPLQGRSDQDVYALELVRRLAPKAVILDHWDNSFPPMTGEIDLSGFSRNMGSRSIPCLVLTPGQTIQLEKKERT